jgi:hypothetical protein
MATMLQLRSGEYFGRTVARGALCGLSAIETENRDPAMEAIFVALDAASATSAPSTQP